MSIIDHVIEVNQTDSINTATVFLFHGAGGNATDFLETITTLIGELSFNHIKLIIPTAPLQNCITRNGQPLNVWFNRKELNPNVSELEDSLKNIENCIKDLIFKEVTKGIPLNRIVVGGYSLGGGLTLHTAYRWISGLAGAFTLSSFLSHDSSVYENLKNNRESTETPLRMFHGKKDDLISFEWGKKTFENLHEFVVDANFTVFEDGGHELRADELKIAFEWIQELLPPV